MSNIPYSPTESGIAYAPQRAQTTGYPPQTTGYPPQTKEGISVSAAPVHPQPAQVLSHQQTGYVVRPGPMVPAAQHFTPPTGPEQDWQHGLFDCFDNWKICCLGFWVPCVLYSRTHKRIRTSPSTLRSFSFCNSVCWCNMCCGVGRFRQRDEIRYRYNLKGSLMGDYFRELYCGQCTLCQEEMEVRDRERQMAQMHSAGYVAPQQMSYAQPPQ